MNDNPQTVTRVIPSGSRYGEPTVIQQKLDRQVDPITEQGMTHWKEYYLPKSTWVGNWGDVLKVVGGSGTFFGVISWIAAQPFWLLAIILSVTVASVLSYWGVEVYSELPNGYIYVALRVMMVIMGGIILWF